MGRALDKTFAMQLDPDDLRIDLIRVAGDGPCHVRLVHLPTGASVTVGDQSSIEENRERALALLTEELGAGTA
jgi:protein subunit release factor A